MIVRFVTPLVLTGLALVAGPLIVHLLRRRERRRLVVPSLRFVPDESDTAVKLRAPADLTLLAVRMFVIACAVTALAGPVMITDRRAAAWDARIVRAVVVLDGASAPEAERTVDEERATAFLARRFDGRSAQAGLVRAAAWLSDAPPARREVVIVSDLRHGSLNAADIGRVPPEAGLRFRTVPAAIPPAGAEFVEMIRDQPHERQTRVDGWRTGLALVPGRTPQPALIIEGTSVADAEALRHTLWTAGVLIPPPPAVTRIRFAPAATRDPRSASSAAEAAAQRLLLNPAVHDVEFSAGGDRDELVIETRLSPTSLDAARLTHAALNAWHDPSAGRAHETQAIARETLDAWARPPAPAGTASWRRAERTDARWLWLLALAGLALDTWMRRRAVPVEGMYVRAA